MQDGNNTYRFIIDKEKMPIIIKAKNQKEAEESLFAAIPNCFIKSVTEEY